MSQFSFNMLLSTCFTVIIFLYTLSLFYDLIMTSIARIPLTNSTFVSFNNLIFTNITSSVPLMKIFFSSFMPLVAKLDIFTYLAMSLWIDQKEFVVFWTIELMLVLLSAISTNLIVAHTTVPYWSRQHLLATFTKYIFYTK